MCGLAMGCGRSQWTEVSVQCMGTGTMQGGWWVGAYQCLFGSDGHQCDFRNDVFTLLCKSPHLCPSHVVPSNVQ